MKVLVTGATGFVGAAVVRQLLSQGHTLVQVARSVQNSSQDIIHAVELGARPHWPPLLEGCDAVVHLAARVHVMQETVTDAANQYDKINVDATKYLAEQAVKAGVKRFIYLSSLKVNGEENSNGRAFVESDAPQPKDNYAQSKYQAEQVLLNIAKKSALEVVIIRPPLVYGPSVRANFLSLLKVVNRGVLLPLKSVRNQRSYVYVENLAHFILLCLEHPSAANQIYLVSDGHDLSTPELIQKCAEALGVKPRLISFPQSWLAYFCKPFGKSGIYQRLCGDLSVDISKAKNLLGWQPPYSVEEGLAATAQAFKNKK